MFLTDSISIEYPGKLFRELTKLNMERELKPLHTIDKTWVYNVLKTNVQILPRHVTIFCLVTLKSRILSVTRSLIQSYLKITTILPTVSLKIIESTMSLWMM
ncbi:hypothetical protein CDAR_439571 [Caerostris darwini]|uniref:Uncharacterized protein n=1 Tax=Caerostris darwini TaxID=1538125 RepID=A0AAV4MIZ0_9ARAC|nr:hypothetical protein CDAR_439571 [Caerostris darwini]